MPGNEAPIDGNDGRPCDRSDEGAGIPGIAVPSGTRAGDGTRRTGAEAVDVDVDDGREAVVEGVEGWGRVAGTEGSCVPSNRFLTSRKSPQAAAITRTAASTKSARHFDPRRSGATPDRETRAADTYGVKILGMDNL